MITYPDVSHYQAGLSLRGAVACFAKVTEGTTFVDPAYINFRKQATALGIPFGAYHWVNAESVTAQARHAYSMAGQVPMMWDAEAAGSTVARLLQLTQEYRALGGVVHLAYLPRWWWSGHLGAPDLRPLREAGLALVASHYGEGPDSTAGWSPYGGVTPTALQYTSTQLFNGARVDFNAYRGTVAQFQALMSGQMMSGEDMLKDEILPGAGSVSAATALRAVYDALPMLRTDDVRLNNLANVALPATRAAIADVLAAVTADPDNEVHIPEEDRKALAADILAAIAAQLSAGTLNQPAAPAP